MTSASPDATFTVNLADPEIESAYASNLEQLSKGLFFGDTYSYQRVFSGNDAIEAFAGDVLERAVGLDDSLSGRYPKLNQFWTGDRIANHGRDLIFFGTLGVGEAALVDMLRPLGDPAAIAIGAAMVGAQFTFSRGFRQRFKNLRALWSKEAQRRIHSEDSSRARNLVRFFNDLPAFPVKNRLTLAPPLRLSATESLARLLLDPPRPGALDAERANYRKLLETYLLETLQTEVQTHRSFVDMNISEYYTKQGSRQLVVNTKVYIFQSPPPSDGIPLKVDKDKQPELGGMLPFPTFAR